MQLKEEKLICPFNKRKGVWASRDKNGKEVKLMEHKGYFSKNLFMQIDTSLPVGVGVCVEVILNVSAQNNPSVNVAYLEVAYSDPFQTGVLQNKTTSYFTGIMGLFRNSRGIAIREKKAVTKTIDKPN